MPLPSAPEPPGDRVQAQRRATIAELHRSEWPRIVATLARRYRSLDIAEEAASEAFVAAIERWRDELPPNPGGWLMATATHRAIDRLRRDSQRDSKYTAALAIGRVGLVANSPEQEVESMESEGPIADDRLRLMFTCCHPALARDAQVALTLRMVGGLTVEEIARGLLHNEAAVGQRITRAKAKIAAAAIPYRVPDQNDLPERLDARADVDDRGPDAQAGSAPKANSYH